MSAALLLLAAMPASAQDWARKMFETTKHEFGAVARGAHTEYRFKFSNIYIEDVHVSGVRSSCGCTTPRVTKDSIKTYEESEIVAVFNTHLFQGQRGATVTVTFDKPFYAEVQLQVSGLIRSDIIMTPGQIDLGTVDRGTTAEKSISVSYAGRSDWRILEARPGSPYVQAQLTETSRGGGSVAYSLAVKLKPDAPIGYLRDQVMLITNDGRTAEVPVDIEAKVVSEVSVSPASLFLGAVEPGQKVTKQVVIQGKRPFKITGIKCDNAQCFEIATPDTAKILHLLPIVYTASAEPGKITYKIIVETDLGKDVAPEISAYAQVLERKQ